VQISDERPDLQTGPSDFCASSPHLDLDHARIGTLALRHTQKVAPERSPRRTSRPGAPCREKPGLIPGKGTETQTSLTRAKESRSGASNRFRRFGGGLTD
jgi:hypothetical protein